MRPEERGERTLVGRCGRCSNDKVIYSYEVSSEKQDEYLKITRDEIKPFWESHGCQAYRVWQSQDDSNVFMKEMFFTDEGTMQSTMKLAEAEPIKKLFFQFANNITRITYRQVVLVPAHNDGNKSPAPGQGSGGI